MQVALSDGTELHGFKLQIQEIPFGPPGGPRQMFSFGTFYFVLRDYLGHSVVVTPY